MAVFRTLVRHRTVKVVFLSEAKILSSDFTFRGLSQITFALRVGRWSEKRVVYYIKSAN